MRFEIPSLLAIVAIVGLIALIGLIPAAIAYRKGRSFALWWLYGAALVVVALPHALLMKAGTTTGDRQVTAGVIRTCRRCGEKLKLDAMICPACQQPLARVKRAARPTPATGRFKTRQEYERWKATRRR